MVESAEPQLDDAELAARVKRGDRDAFSQLYSRHHMVVYGYFRARVLDPHIAEDLSQEAFLRVFGAIARFNTELRFQSWLMGICRNVLREQVRHIMRRRESGWTELCMELEDMVSGDGLYDDVLHLVPACMAKLSEPSAQSLHWHYMGGMKVEKIAKRLGRTLGAVKVLMVRARQALKRCIATHLKGGAES
ncbi:MAG: RNA polymerase sigma factor [Phycisphaeraceae bacterium]